MSKLFKYQLGNFLIKNGVIPLKPLESKEPRKYKFSIE